MRAVGPLAAKRFLDVFLARLDPLNELWFTVGLVGSFAALFSAAGVVEPDVGFAEQAAVVQSPGAFAEIMIGIRFTLATATQKRNR